jgi:hypothetical protein
VTCCLSSSSKLMGGAAPAAGGGLTYSTRAFHHFPEIIKI